ncbi:glutaredoxin family protein [Marinagarivorans algicola]|uniref:glutaredoxin family protein n=1 Tax=Marinagarivorans algicola TaxID=1513270 RepID=UPI0006B679F8|nr:glutaredoxin domain-containing protein [Marinagarivorans algicola]
MTRLKQVIPLVLFVGMAGAVIAGVQKGLSQSRAPLVDPNHPKVVNNELPSVVLYSAEWCTYCKAARTYFTSKNVPFVERDIEKSPQAEREYRRLGGQGIPLITINDHRIQGFDKTGFKSVYLGEIEL